MAGPGHERRLGTVAVTCDRGLISVVPIGGAACDLGLVDRLLQLHLAAGRLGWSVELTAASAELRELLALLGLDGVLALDAGREAEDGEQLGVEEVHDAGDDPA